MKYLYLALLITNFCSIVAKAEKIKPTHVGRELYTICFEMTDFAKQSYCLGFIMGVSDSSNSDNYCIPETAGGDQIRDHVLSFLHKHVGFVISALTQVFFLHRHVGFLRRGQKTHMPVDKTAF